MRLCSRAYLDTEQSEQPHIKRDWLDGEADGLIALSGGPNGPLDAAIGAGQGALAQSRCEELQRLFGDRLYIELQRHGMAAERVAEPALIELAYARGLPLVATNEPFFAVARRLRGARRAAVHRRRPAACRTATAASSRPSTASRPAPKWRRCSPICPRRWRRPSRSPNAAPSGRARKGPILPRFSTVQALTRRLRRLHGSRRRQACRAERSRAVAQAARAGLERRLARHPLAPGHTPRTITTGWPSSSASSRR